MTFTALKVGLFYEYLHIMANGRFDIHTSRYVTECERGTIPLGMDRTSLMIGFRTKYVAAKSQDVCLGCDCHSGSVSLYQADLSSLIFKMGCG